MNICNFIILFFISVLFFFAGTFGHRFDRHTTTKNGINENEKIGEGVHLLSDDKEAPTVSDGDDIRFIGPGNAQLQLTNDQLQFEFCTRNCMDEIITACYDAVNPNPLLQGSCASNQCEFKAGVYEAMDTKVLWLGDVTHAKLFTSKICERATMQSSEAELSFLTAPLNSCQPNITDGNVINLYISDATSECFIKVLNAKKWIPTTTPAPSTSPTITQKPSEDSSSALMPLWIVLGIFLFILVAAVIIIVILCWRKQKRASVAPANIGPSKIAVQPRNKTEANAIEESVVTDNDKKESVEQPKMPNSDANEKNEIVKQSKSKKKRKMKQKKAVIREKSSNKKKRAKVSKASMQKSSTEQSKVSAEPTVPNATTEASTVQPEKPKPLRVTVPDKPILPDPKFNQKRTTSDGKDSLSGKHDPSMILLIESQPVILKRLCENYFNKTPNSAGIQQTMDRFFQIQGDQKPPLQDRECALFCAPSLTVMFEGVEAMIDDAQQALAHQGVKFDEDDEIEGMSKRAEKYLQDPTTPEFVRCYAFGTIFGSLIDSNVQIDKLFSIPLLFVIVLQRRNPVLNRRKALAFIRRKLPIIESEFSEKERSKMAYPINAIEGALQIDPAGFKNLGSIETESCVVEDETQVETIDELADESEEPPPKTDLLKRFRKKKQESKK